MPIPGYTSQLPLPDSCPVADAIEQFAVAGIEERGAIFTRREVVEFILDLSGYTADQPLYNHRLLEPSFGEGDFLLIAIERLLDSWQRSDSRSALVEALAGCLRGVELHRSSFERTRAKAATLLRGEGLSEEEAAWLVDTWLVQSDFLLADLPGAFDHVVGNPPYVRQELIPDALIVEYRARYSTIFDRADIYIPFIERSLTLLNEGGTLGYICADRWMKNRYGGPLRKLVAHQYHLKVYVDMVDTDAFHTEVIAYPAITIITREKPGRTRIAHRPPIEKQALVELAHQLLAHDQPAPGGPVKEMAGVAAGAEPWLLQSPDQLMVIRRLERDFPLLENTGCKVGIGVATGADKAFIGPYEGLDVEPDRKLPLVMTRDLLNGEVQWRGLGVVNPFADDGGLVELDRYPRLKRYLEERRSQISKRHIAQKAPASWFRTIDRIYPAITKEPKLLVPDIKGEAHIVYEAGQLYPHHNLYYITSSEWDLKALRAVLLSGIAKLFVSVYSTRMRGGYLRFQAQYLRRIRLPHWDSVPATLKKRLINAAERGDVGACNKAVFRLYGLSEEERAAIGGNGD